MSESFSTESYVERRERLMQAFPEAVIVVRGQGETGLNPNFRYLTGLTEPSASLVLAGNGLRVGTGFQYPGPGYQSGERVDSLLFLPPRNALAAQWGEDAAATLESADPATLGVGRCVSSQAFASTLDSVLMEADALAWVRGYQPKLAGGEPDDSALLERIRRRFLHLSLVDATPVVEEMRRVKDPTEIAILRRAIAVVDEALRAVLTRMAPGVRESELEGELTRVYRTAGGTHSFEPIVASGDRARQLHYTSNGGVLASGDLLLIDTGCCIDGYCADITRTYPVDGLFSDRQREIYEAVLGANRATIAAAAPGVELGTLHATAFGHLDQLGLASSFPHGTSHHLGLETHDVGDRYRPLEAGCIITVEPGCYLEREALGVRLEEDVLITASGADVLSSPIAIDAEAVEAQIARARESS